MREGEVRDCLLNLIAGLEQWEAKPEELPAVLRKGHRQLVRGLFEEGKEAPVDLPALIRLLQKPAEAWGLPIHDVFPPEAPLLVQYLGLSPAAREFILLHDSPEEAQSKEMLAILQYCRQVEPMLDEKYRLMREFVIRNPVVTATELMTFGLALQDRELNKRFLLCYEDITQDLERYRRCPRCGWTLEYRGGWRCGTEDLCGSLESRNELAKWNAGQTMHRLRPGMYRYTMLPGLAEIAVKENLVKKGFNVTLFPEVDRYDLAVELPSNIVYLDMKDFKHPLNLAGFFNRMDAQQLAKYGEPHVYIVIPKYRNELFPGYARLVKRALKPHADHVQVIGEREILRVLKEASRS